MKIDRGLDATDPGFAVRTIWVLALGVVMTASVTAHAGSRTDLKAYDGHAANDCGASFSEGNNRTETCFDIQSGDETLDLIIRDDSGLPVAALVYFEDDDDNMIESRGTKEHLLCGRGETRGPLVHEPLFLVPPLATKVVVRLGEDNIAWDAYPVTECLIAGRPGHWGSTGVIEAIFGDRS